MIGGVTRFQRDRGLTADGEIVPGGETERAMQESLADLARRMRADWAAHALRDARVPHAGFAPRPAFLASPPIREGADAGDTTDEGRATPSYDPYFHDPTAGKDEAPVSREERQRAKMVLNVRTNTIIIHVGKPRASQTINNAAWNAFLASHFEAIKTMIDRNQIQRDDTHHRTLDRFAPP